MSYAVDSRVPYAFGMTSKRKAETRDADGDSKKRTKRSKITVAKGDLFKHEGKTVLAHCVSRDLRMDAGIAKTFKAKYGKPSKTADVGDVAVLDQVDHRFIYHLITKERFFQKPTYDSLDKSLRAMKRHALEHKIQEIAMPQIGCGLDRLRWSRVESMLEQLFADTEIVIRVWDLGTSTT